MVRNSSFKWGYDPTGGTPWEEVKQLPAGHCIGVDMVPLPYWDWKYIHTPDDLGEAFRKSVKNRLVSDQPIAMLLSGGLDSTLTFKVAQELGADLKVFHAENEEKYMFLQAISNHPYEELVTELPSIPDAVEAMQSPSDAGSLLPQYALGAAFLAPEIVKYALGLSWSRRTEKEELKRIARGIVPQGIIDQPKKPLKSIGFNQNHRINLSNIWGSAL